MFQSILDTCEQNSLRMGCYTKFKKNSSLLIHQSDAVPIILVLKLLDMIDKNSWDVTEGSHLRLRLRLSNKSRTGEDSRSRNCSDTSLSLQYRLLQHCDNSRVLLFPAWAQGLTHLKKGCQNRSATGKVDPYGEPDNKGSLSNHQSAAGGKKTTH